MHRISVVFCAQGRKRGRAAPFGDTLVYLTAEELTALGEQAEALLAPYLHRTTDRPARPPGARRVSWLHLAVATDR